MNALAPALVLSWNLDMNEPYVYDLTSDHAYEPFDKGKKYANLYVDFHSFGKKDVLRLCGLDESYKNRSFCLLDEFYFFRTILEWEGRRPTLVLKDAENYKKHFNFEDFLHIFGQTYKIIYHRWKSFESSEATESSEDSEKSNVSFHVMFRNDGGMYTFREWMSRV